MLASEPSTLSSVIVDHPERSASSWPPKDAKDAHHELGLPAAVGADDPESRCSPPSPLLPSSASDSVAGGSSLDCQSSSASSSYSALLSTPIHSARPIFAQREPALRPQDLASLRTTAPLSVVQPPQQLQPEIGSGRPSPVTWDADQKQLKTPMELLAESMKGRMLFAIPKKGRLYNKCLEVLEGADIKFSRSHRLDVCLVQNHPITLVFLPASDIPRFVAHGNVDLGITGQDTIIESRTQDGVTELLPLGFGGCKLQVQVPQKSGIETVEDLCGKRVVTSYTTLARDYFRRLDESLGLDVAAGKGTQVEYVGGSVEAACALGLADGIVDLVESGDTMRAAGLQAISTVMTTEAVLIKSTNPKHPDLIPLIKKVTSRIAGFVASNKYVICQYNVPRELLPVVTKITPGRRAPTISSIEDDGWVAVSAMVERKMIANVMDELVEAGAEDTFVLSLQNCRVETRFSNGMIGSSTETPEIKKNAQTNGYD